VGVILAKKVGERVDAGDTLCTIHAADSTAAHSAAARVLDAYSITDGRGVARVRSGEGTAGEGPGRETLSVQDAQEGQIVLERITS